MHKKKSDDNNEIPENSPLEQELEALRSMLKFAEDDQTEADEDEKEDKDGKGDGDKKT